MQTIRPEVTGKAEATKPHLVANKAAPSTGPPMTLEEFVRIFALPPIVPNKRACEILGCGHSKYYLLSKEGRLRIIPRPGGGTGAPVQDLYHLFVEAVSA